MILALADSLWEISQQLHPDLVGVYIVSTSLKGSWAVFRISNTYALNLVILRVGIDPTDRATHVPNEVEESVYASIVYRNKRLEAFRTELVRESVVHP